METTESPKKTSDDGYETIRVKAELKNRILKLQNQHFTETSGKISVTELLRQSLDAKGKITIPLHALLDQILASGDLATKRKVETLLHAAVDVIKRQAAGKPPLKRSYKIGGKRKEDPECDD